MSIINYIVLALGLSITALIASRNSAEQHPVQLTQGLLHSLIMGVGFALLMAIGVLIGNLLAFDIPSVDRNVFLGLFLVVIVKLLFGNKKSQASFNITKVSVSILMAVAVGINPLLIGISVGFTNPLSWLLVLCSLVFTLLMSFWGIMLGRKKVDIRQRRWQLISVLCLLVVMLVSIISY